MCRVRGAVVNVVAFRAKRRGSKSGRGCWHTRAEALDYSQPNWPHHIKVYTNVTKFVGMYWTGAIWNGRISVRTNRRKGLLNKILKLIVSVYLSKCHEEELYARNVVNKFLSCLSVWYIVLGPIFNFVYLSVCLSVSVCLCLPVFLVYYIPFWQSLVCSFF